MSKNLRFLESNDDEYITEFFDFYNELTPQVFDLDSKNDDFFNEVKSVKFHYFKKAEETFVMKSGIKFDDEAIRCAYLLRYSVLNSFCTFKHFQKVYNCNPIIQLKGAITVRICCFGGGAGTEIFAICKVISEFLRSISNEGHQHSIKLKFIVIDVCNEWKSWIFQLVKKLRNCDKNVVNVKIKFIQADLTEQWEEDVLKAVQKADILTMVKFLSDLNLKEVDYKKRKDFDMLTNVAQEMKLNSWIFFLDVAGGKYHRKINKKLNKFHNFQLSQSSLQSHSIYKDELEISEPFLSFMYSVMPESRTTTVSSSTWQKCVQQDLIVKQKKKVKKGRKLHQLGNQL